MKYEIKVFSELDSELKEDWQNFEANSHNYCFQSYDWFENWIRNFHNNDKNNSICIVKITVESKILCIFPLEIERKKNLKILKWVGSKHSDYMSPLLSKDFNLNKIEFINLWKKIIELIPKIDLVYFNKQPEYIGKIKNPFVSYFKNHKDSITYHISLPRSWKEYTTQTLKKNFHIQNLRKKKLLKKLGKVSFKIIKDVNEKNKYIDELIKQKKEKLKKNIKNSFTSEDLNFYKNLEKWENRNYAIQISSIKLNSEFIAIHWGVFNKNYYHYLLPSMKEKNVKQFSPGKLLLSLLIRWSISKKIKFFDFGFGEESYKKKWSNKKIYIFNYIKPKSLNGVFVYIFLIARQIIKKLKNNNN